MPSGGQVLAERYRLDRRIAIGGMGEVWQADDTRLDRQVAVKVLKPELSGDAEFRRRFHAEARMTASLNHPGIAAVHDYGEAPGEFDSSGGYLVAYLVMELIAGEPLATILARDHRLSVDRTLDILVQAGNALQAAHERGLVHRDIKPANIMITPSGGVKLTDFGIARAVDAAPMTGNGMVMGTAHYIAPEQAAGNEAGPAGDVYSLAVVGYECLAGQRPFSGDSALSVAMMHIRDQPPPLPADVPRDVRELIEAALAKDPRRRYHTGGEFAAAAAAVRAGRRPPPVTPDERLAPTALLPPLSEDQLAATQAVPHESAPVQSTSVQSTSGRQPFVQATQRRAGRRGAGRFALILLGALALVLGGYLVRDALSSPSAPSGSATGTPSAPVPTATPPVFEPGPNREPPGPPPSDGDGGPEEVLIIPTDYWGHRGSDAVVTAKAHGLIPRVVDEDGDLVDPDRRSLCRIIEVVPLTGYVPRGSTLQLTCRRGK